MIFCDLDRRLPQTDPFDRQILIGFGCFLEIARIAAAAAWLRHGDHAVSRRVFGRTARPPPDRKPALCSVGARRRRIRCLLPSRTGVRTRRHSTPRDRLKEACLMRSRRIARRRRKSEPPSTQPWCSACVAIPGTRGTLNSRPSEPGRKASTSCASAENEIDRNPDGISIGGPFLEALALAGQLSREQLARPGTIAYSASADRYRPIMASSMGYAWVTTPGNSRIDQLAAGRAFVRINLEAARLGLGFHPVSQALQEFPEMAKSFAEVHATLNAPPGTRIQMLARLGYGSVAAKTPRWPLASRLIGA